MCVCVFVRFNSQVLTPGDKGAPINRDKAATPVRHRAASSAALVDGNSSDDDDKFDYDHMDTPEMKSLAVRRDDDDDDDLN